MSRVLLLSMLLSFAACAHSEPPTVPDSFPEGGAFVTLNGERVKVTWSDGDSFKFRGGPYKGKGVRLTGYNTLESYGPVHRWGEWTGAELYEIARSSKYLAATEVWDCTTDGELDTYRRVLVTCPGVVQAMIASGHAHVFMMDAEADPDLLAVQRKAQKRRWGIWAKGVPDVIVTSLHSGAENEDGAAYNRAVSTETGKSATREHTEVYEICQEVCEGDPKSGSCMTYVPFTKRYRGKPDCLR